MRSCLFVGALLALATRPALAQQLALPGPPQPSATPVALPDETIGLTYSIELRSGTSFLGTLRTATAQELVFDTKDLGTVTVQRTNLRQLLVLTGEQTRKGYDNIGNGNRLLFAPTARNLHRGEGYVQSAYLFLVGVNYGVTDYFSIGALFSFVPSAGTDNFFSLTPKVSVPVGNNLHVGAGAILGVTSGGTFGVTYANGTYGSADHNLTLGVGYGFANNSFSSTPAFVLGGATRVSRRLSLMSELYYVHTSDTYSTQNTVVGIGGVRLAAQRFSGSLGILAVSYSEESKSYYGNNSDGVALPYVEASYRFGNVRPAVRR